MCNINEDSFDYVDCKLDEHESKLQAVMTTIHCYNQVYNDLLRQVLKLQDRVSKQQKVIDHLNCQIDEIQRISHVQFCGGDHQL